MAATMAATATTASSSLQGDEEEGQRYHVLVEFLYKHLDFQMAELESVLSMYGIDLMGTADGCRMIPLPANKDAVASSPSPSSEGIGNTTDTGNNNNNSDSVIARLAVQGVTSRRPFVILSFPIDSKFVPKKNSSSSDDRVAAAAAATKQQKKSVAATGDIDNSGNNHQHVEDIGSILTSRCTLVRSVMEIWGVGTTIESCAAATQRYIQHNPLGRALYHQNQNGSWKLTVHTLGAKYTPAEQNVMRSAFDFLDLRGPVQMIDAANEFVLIREIELDVMGSPLYPRLSHLKQPIPANESRPPLACYFARALGGARPPRGRASIEQYSLKKRSYLGPTSMDAELSFIMTNLGHVKHGSMVLDPFVGTGSILVSCALRGAYCVGTDIDIRVLRGRHSEENIFSNFRQFNLPRPELIRSDNAIYHRHFNRSGSVPLYDAILTDPPYGIRAGARQTGSRHEDFRPVLEDQRHDHIAKTKPYPVSDVMADLMDVAARTLVLGGRLVYIIPSVTDFDPETDLPRHDCLRLVHVCYQPLSSELGRRMVAMEKVAEYDEAKRSDYLATVWKNGPASAEKVANIRDKLIEAAKKKPGYEERAAVRKQKRREHKEAKKRAKIKGDSPPKPEGES